MVVVEKEPKADAHGGGNTNAAFAEREDGGKVMT